MLAPSLLIRRHLRAGCEKHRGTCENTRAGPRPALSPRPPIRQGHGPTRRRPARRWDRRRRRPAISREQGGLSLRLASLRALHCGHTREHDDVIRGPEPALVLATSREAGARGRRPARTRREGCAGRRDRAGWRSQRRGYVSSSQPGGPPSRSARPPLGHGVAQARPRRGRAPGMDEKDSCRAIPGAPPPSLLPFVRSGSHRQPEPGTAFIAEELRGR